MPRSRFDAGTFTGVLMVPGLLLVLIVLWLVGFGWRESALQTCGVALFVLLLFASSVVATSRGRRPPGRL